MLLDSELSKVDKNGNLTAGDLLPWLRKVDQLIVLVSPFDKGMREATLNNHLEAVEDIYKIVTGQVSPDGVRGERREQRVTGER